jgi:BirA family transcriptional regulator, biotin operon repressor / biotin---[acetyl-CoA-carboxylase] ligase
VAAETTARATARTARSYDGESARSIVGRLGLADVRLYASVGSTMDVAHALAAAGAPAGTLVLADQQTAGRGRHGSFWSSPRAFGIWMTMVERPDDPGGLEVLSLRVGLAAARALDAFAAAPVDVKWPNDLFVAGGKVGGVLVETRWRGERPDWVAIGLGVNLRRPDGVARAAALGEGVSRIAVLSSLVPAIRNAASLRGSLDAREHPDYAARDYAAGRRCTAPTRGVVLGVTPVGSLAVRTAHGVEHHRAGSLVLEEAM